MFKKLAIIFVAVFCVLLSVPTIAPSLQPYFPSWIKPVPLGLDLKGGAQLLLEVDTDTMFQEKAVQLYDETRSALIDRNKGVIRFSNLRNHDGVVSLVVRDADEVSDAKGRLKSAFGNTVDITSDGKTITLSYSDKQKAEMTQDALARSIEIVRRRIDALGTKEPSIQSQGGKYIMIQLPGVDNPERIKDLIGQTAKLTFHLVNENVSAEQMASGRAPSGTQFLPYVDMGGQMVPVYSRVEVSGESLKDSQAEFDQNNMPVVTTVFDASGARRFAKLTTEHVNERFAIVLDGKVLSAPVIREPIPGGRGQISGGFSLQGAKDLAVLLRSGALPAPLQVIEERVVGAGLGAQGKIGSVAGVALIFMFLFLVYRFFGVLAGIALMVNLGMIVGVTALFGATLTLPGIAGIVLTLGMAVDANVLPFERIRDEVKAGVPTLRAVNLGFDRSIKTVMDGNLTTLIAALVLFQFGAGPIRGFAVTLSIGILTTLFTCVWLSKLLVDWYMGGKNKKIGFIK